MDEDLKHDCTQCKYKRDCKDYKIVPIRRGYGVQYMCVPGKKCKGFEVKAK